MGVCAACGRLKGTIDFIEISISPWVLAACGRLKGTIFFIGISMKPWVYGFFWPAAFSLWLEGTEGVHERSPVGSYLLRK